MEEDTWSSKCKTFKFSGMTVSPESNLEKHTRGVTSPFVIIVALSNTWYTF